MGKHSTDKAAGNVVSYTDAGDLMARDRSIKQGSAQEQYYAFALQKAKMEAATKEETKWMAVQSPEDELAVKIAKRLSDVKPGSPLWNQLVDVCDGETDRYKQAHHLASIQLRKEQAKQILAVYGAPKDKLSSIFGNAWTSGATLVAGSAPAAAAGGAARSASTGSALPSSA